MTIVLGGGGGGGADQIAGGAGGTGARVTLRLAVVPGDVVSGTVGAGGQSGYTSGNNPIYRPRCAGFGNGGTGFANGGRGGGANCTDATTVWASGGGSSSIIRLNDTILSQAAGGGGGYVAGSGGASGNNNGNPSPSGGGAGSSCVSLSAAVSNFSFSASGGAGAAGRVTLDKLSTTSGVAGGVSITPTAPVLTLAKLVVNTGGGTQPTTAWTLSATGPWTISGATGTTAVTAVPVNVGTYALSETGPAGYSASLYSCVKNGGAAVFGNSISLASSDIATCSITNSYIQLADLSIVKTNGTNSVIGGGATTYTLTITNNGPNSVTGALVTDTVGAGITCPLTNVITITGNGIPAGSFTFADLAGAGIALGTLSNGQSAVLTYTCNVP